MIEARGGDNSHTLLSYLQLLHLVFWGSISASDISSIPNLDLLICVFITPPNCELSAYAVHIPPLYLYQNL